jgi:hypothetical protein
MEERTKDYECNQEEKDHPAKTYQSKERVRQAECVEAYCEYNDARRGPEVSFME